MDSPGKLMEEQKKLEEELLDDNSEMSGTEEGPQLLDVSMEDDEGGATTDSKLSASRSISDTPVTSKGGPSVLAPVPAPVSAPVGAHHSATSTGGPPELTRQLSSTGGPPHSANCGEPCPASASAGNSSGRYLRCHRQVPEGS